MLQNIFDSKAQKNYAGKVPITRHRLKMFAKGIPIYIEIVLWSLVIDKLYTQIGKENWTFCFPVLVSRHCTCALGWSDSALFCELRKATGFCWSGIFFRRSISRIWQISQRAKFPFSNNRRDIAYECFFWKFADSFLIQQRTIPKKKISN